jgi:hypothetical protein
MNYQPSFQGTGATLDPVTEGLDGPRDLLTDQPRGRDGSGQPPRRRVPDCDIIYVGPASRGTIDDPIDVRELAFKLPARPAGSAATQAPPAGRRSWAPWLAALLALELAAWGGVYLGKRYADSQVIVVPTTASERSVIT